MTKRKPKIEIARAYDPPASNGSYRVLVDRLWPRGVKKEDLEIDTWVKEVAPSTELRRWFNHDPERWNEFRKRYFKELQDNQAAVSELLEAAGDAPVLLLYGAKDQEHNQAVALKEWIEERKPAASTTKKSSTIKKKMSAARKK